MTDTNPVDPSKIMHLNERFKKDAEEEMQEFANPLDFIMADRKKRQVEVAGVPSLPDRPNPPQPDAPAKTQPKITMVAIDGHVLPGDTITMMLYSLVTLARKDKKIAKLLRSFKYVMKDVNGEVIWK